jgi:hypothetical protein
MPSVKSAKQTLIHDDTKEGEVAVHYNFFFLSFGRNSRHFRRGGLTAVYWRCVLTCLVPPFFRQLNMRAEMLGR